MNCISLAVLLIAANVYLSYGQLADTYWMKVTYEKEGCEGKKLSQSTFRSPVFDSCFPKRDGSEYFHINGTDIVIKEYDGLDCDPSRLKRELTETIHDESICTGFSRLWLIEKVDISKIVVLYIIEDGKNKSREFTEQICGLVSGRPYREVFNAVKNLETSFGGLVSVAPETCSPALEEVSFFVSSNGKVSLYDSPDCTGSYKTYSGCERLYLDDKIAVVAPLPTFLGLKFPTMSPTEDKSSTDNPSGSDSSGSQFSALIVGTLASVILHFW